MRHPMRGPLGVQWVYIHALSHGCCFCEGELKRLKTKAEPLKAQPVSLYICFGKRNVTLFTLQLSRWITLSLSVVIFCKRTSSTAMKADGVYMH